VDYPQIVSVIYTDQCRLSTIVQLPRSSLFLVGEQLPSSLSVLKFGESGDTFLHFAVLQMSTNSSEGQGPNISVHIA
jgi:hypothetical protein